MSSIHTGGMFDEDLYDESDEILGFEDLDLYETWEDRMASGNDYIVAIAASSRTEMSGTGKTTLATQLCRTFDDSETGFDATEKATLSSDEVTNQLYPNAEPRSAILFDEAQGTANSDGVDNRRAMADEVMKMSRAAATHRWKQITLVIVSQSTRWIDSRMLDILDRLILIQEKNHDEGWARAVIFDHYFRDLPSSGKGERTPAIEDIYWYPLPEDDPDYKELHEMKARAGDPTNGSDGDDEDNEDDGGLGKPQQVELARYLYEGEDKGFAEIARTPLIEYSREWVRRHVRDSQRKSGGGGDA